MNKMGNFVYGYIIYCQLTIAHTCTVYVQQHLCRLYNLRSLNCSGTSLQSLTRDIFIASVPQSTRQNAVHATSTSAGHFPLEFHFTSSPAATSCSILNKLQNLTLSGSPHKYQPHPLLINSQTEYYHLPLLPIYYYPPLYPSTCLSYLSWASTSSITLPSLVIRTNLR